MVEGPELRPPFKTFHNRTRLLKEFEWLESLVSLDSAVGVMTPHIAYVLPFGQIRINYRHAFCVYSDNLPLLRVYIRNFELSAIYDVS